MPMSAGVSNWSAAATTALAAHARRGRRFAHAAVVAIALTPLAGLVLGAVTGALGANPVETITHTTGAWALRLLLASLAITPLRRLDARLAALAPYRRTLGLLAFAYTLLHAATFFALDLGLALALLAEEIAERPYIALGFAALLALTPLAVTSTRAWQRRLGRRWMALHRLVYVAAILAALHFIWLVKKDLREPLAYAAVLGLLLGARAVRARWGVALRSS
ncbi:MAG TPA: ferric reductase-like transmembrane domain-containing protein [Myxococcota bacterium]|nr:ferric reductase-like transmembrane domain-containing protein [Myxococcota bacterium]